MNIITINANSFLKGFSLSDYYNNGGFSPKSLGFEIDRGDYLGSLLPGRSLLDKSTNLSGNVVASVKYYKAGSGFVYYLITDSGKVFLTNNTDPINPTHTLLDTITGKTFSTRSSIYSYKNGIYISSDNDIYYDDSTFSIKDKTWWTTTKGKSALVTGVPHKIFEFDGKMYVTNGNKLVSWDGTTANESAFTLPTGWIITDVICDSENIYISATYQTNSQDYNSITKIYVWNSFTTITWQKEINIFTPPITAMVKANDSIYFFSGGNMYLLNGFYDSVVWLRKCSSPTFNQVIYYNGIIYFLEAYGLGAYNTRFKTFSHPILTSNNLYSINVALSDYFDLFSDSAKMYRCIYSTATTPTFYSNWEDLQNGKVRKIIICFNGALPTNSQYTLDLFDETNTSVYHRVISRTTDGAVNTVTLQNISHPSPINLAQLALTFNSATNLGIRFIKIFYEPSEIYASK